MKILVTGAAGFIGSNLCGYLLRKGHTVVGVDDFNDFYSPKIKHFNISEYEKDPKFKMCPIDIRDRVKVEDVFKNENIEGLVHLAAWAGVTYSVEHPDVYISSNVDGTNNLAEFSAKYNIKSFVFASTSSVYGDSEDVPFVETMNTDKPLSPYPASKKAGEVLLYSYSHNFDLNVTIFRFFNPLGIKIRPDMALPKLIRAAEYGNEFPLYQNPESSARDYTYIDHMLEAIEYVLNKPLKYEIMNLGNSNPVSLIDMKKSVEKITSKIIKTVEKPLPGQMKITYANIDKARSIVQYNPATSLDVMISKYYEWFLKQPDWYKKGDF
ncbi:epimerase [candidate division WWE3 bacterium CG10_big_fil_rev_8_21_14_0_10_32_10]|uniref:Epimerase n=1 Tax=candidate division WWE3 bacterium CG10_big_fil_rev_8_21_14_0_10_32_10 TaxID=1975090 RepID=A0A2H0RAK5_UNCKA|nr:MAG: epimerase [candidate division WWE3 bacterium CG10_big_fil_rev_8_21_14_0_10_32_10]